MLVRDLLRSVLQALPRYAPAPAPLRLRAVVVQVGKVRVTLLIVPRRCSSPRHNRGGGALQTQVPSMTVKRMRAMNKMSLMVPPWRKMIQGTCVISTRAKGWKG